MFIMDRMTFFKIWFALCAVAAAIVIALAAYAVYTVASNPGAVAFEAGQVVGEAKRGFDEAAQPAPTNTATDDMDPYDSTAAAAVVGVAGQM